MPKLRIEEEGLVIEMQARRCERESYRDSVKCRDARVELFDTGGGFDTRLQLETLHVMGDKPFRRGALGGNGGHAPTFTLSDIDGDGREDLLVWTGWEGLYGAPSFDVYLFDPAERRFKFDQDFSDLTIGKTLLSSEQGRIKVGGKDGCCMHFDMTYAIDSGKPKLIEMVTVDSRGDEERAITQRLIDGELKVVKEEAIVEEDIQ